MKFRTKTTLALSALITGTSLHSMAQPTLTGVTIYRANADGSGANGSFWNTRGGDFPYNVYLFTGSVASPVFLTGGDTDFTLNPNLPLSLGVHVLQFAGDSAPGGLLGLNLYFDNNSTNRITAFVPADGSSRFQVVPRSITTYGQNGSQASSGTLSYHARIGDYSVILSDFHTTVPAVNVVSPYASTPNGSSDTAGSFTLTVLPPTSLYASIEVSEVRVCWFAKTNLIYQPQYRSSLTTNLWVDLGGLVQGDESVKCVTDPVSPSQPRRFYQIVELP